MEQTNKEAAAQQPAVITEPKAIGQEFELETVLAEDNRMLKTVLQPHFSSVENANIVREVKNGTLIV